MRYFLAVADELHFTRAAALLHISQPPLSVAVRQLEQELGVMLLDRSTRQVRLTAAGAAFRDRVREILGAVDAAAAEASAVSSGRSGRLRLGFVSSASYTAVPAALREFGARRPQVRLDLLPLASGEQIELLLAGEIDLGIVRDMAPVPGVRLRTLLEEPLVCVLPSGHPLAELDEVPPALIGQQPLVLFSYRLMPGYLARVLAVVNPEQRAVNIVQQTVHQETVLGLVAAGIGVSVLPASVEGARVPGVQLRHLDGRPTCALQIATPDRPSPVALEFTASLAAAVGVAGTAD